jgi:hypothetical protein
LYAPSWLAATGGGDRVRPDRFGEFAWIAASSSLPAPPPPRSRSPARHWRKRISGAKFDLKRFHDVLELGAMPLSMLERIVAERARIA